MENFNEMTKKMHKGFKSVFALEPSSLFKTNTNLIRANDTYFVGEIYTL